VKGDQTVLSVAAAVGGRKGGADVRGAEHFRPTDSIQTEGYPRPCASAGCHAIGHPSAIVIFMSILAYPVERQPMPADGDAEELCADVGSERIRRGGGWYLDYQRLVTTRDSHPP
jgi:hypothetical protein